MRELARVIELHIGKYPKMQAQDAIKLIYQNEFGGGHLIENEAASLQRIESECKASLLCGKMELEPIGNGLARLHLAQNSDAGAVNRIFIQSAKLIFGTADGLKAKLDVLLDLAKQKKLPFSKESIEEYILEHDFSLQPGHSPAFRRFYSPAYRVIFARLYKEII